MTTIVVLALVATLFTWLMTALGAATVIFVKGTNAKIMNLMLGFAAGVMIAASFWSLLQPAIARAEEFSHLPAWAVASAGFLCGAFFIWIADKAVNRARRDTTTPPSNLNERFQRIFLLVLSITLHNIPEGLAVGVAFGALARTGYTTDALMGAFTIALGIALQNFPEGAAVSFPLRREGFSRSKSFFFGQASGMVEPIAGVIGALSVVYIEALLPFALSFAAGTMILVAVHELIPECQSERGERPYFATMGIISGFVLMMILDVALG